MRARPMCDGSLLNSLINMKLLDKQHARNVISAAY